MKIEFDWNAALDEYPDPAYQATGAELMIEVGGTNICRHWDETNGSVRDSILVALYPLAEWLTSNWFSLFHEVNPIQDTMALQRHDLLTVGGGFPWPALRFSSDGETITLSGRENYHPHADVRFISFGNEQTNLGDLELSLTGFLEQVDSRLQEANLSDTGFQSDWNVIKTLPPNELQFCKAAGKLGLDPFAISDDEASQIIAVSDLLPISIQDDFFAVAGGLDIFSVSQRIQATARNLAHSSSRLTELIGIRDEMNDLTSGEEKPWTEGYRAAQNLRAILETGNGPISTSDLFSFFSGNSGYRSFNDFPVLNLNGASSRFGGLLVTNQDRIPVFSFSKRNQSATGDWSKRFAFGRMLFEYLSAPDSETRLVTESQTASQKRNRAFSAELLAPAAGIKARLRGRDSLFEGDVENLAAEFGVSTKVIEHQVANHHIAELRP